MADAHANPSRDPSDDGTLIGMARSILGKFLAGIDDMLPARVVSFDRDANRVTVVPLVKVLTTDDRLIGRAQVASLPVMRMGGGGMVLAFNLRPGDLGWIKANDRDISLITQSYRDEGPNTLRMHSFQDAVFVPDPMTGVAIDAEDSENAVLQTLDGSVRVAIWPDRLKCTAGALSMTIGPSSIDFAGHVNIPDGATINGIEFITHVHSGIDRGSSNTDPPV